MRRRFKPDMGCRPLISRNVFDEKPLRKPPLISTSPTFLDSSVFSIGYVSAFIGSCCLSRKWLTFLTGSNNPGKFQESTAAHSEGIKLLSGCKRQRNFRNEADNQLAWRAKVWALELMPRHGEIPMLRESGNAKNGVVLKFPTLSQPPQIISV